MSILGDAIGRRARRPEPAPPSRAAPVAPDAASSPGPQAPAAPAGATSELRRRRDALVIQVMELHWDLGGLAYEMAIRDHFRLDVLVRRAARLQDRDAELAEVERLLRMEEGAVAGSCPHCRAPHSRGAVFCWQCGATLMERLASSTSAAPGSSSPNLDGPTAVMNALLAPDAGHRISPAPDADGRRPPS